MKLKESLLFEIFSPSNNPHKYSKSYLNLKTLMALERDDEFKFDENITKEFQEITNLFNSFMNNIPLTIIEQYYLKNAINLNKPIFIEYNRNQVIDKKVIDIYIALEEFYNKIFMLGSIIGNLYNLEIKINVKTNNENNNFL